VYAVAGSRLTVWLKLVAAALLFTCARATTPLLIATVLDPALAYMSTELLHPEG
jgi:hypothetical protein